MEKTLKLSLKKDILDKKASICILSKGIKKLVLVAKSSCLLTVYEGNTNNVYEEIRKALDVDLRNGLDCDKVVVQEFVL